MLSARESDFCFEDFCRRDHVMRDRDLTRVRGQTRADSYHVDPRRT